MCLFKWYEGKMEFSKKQAMKEITKEKMINKVKISVHHKKQAQSYKQYKSKYLVGQI